MQNKARRDLHDQGARNKAAGRNLSFNILEIAAGVLLLLVLGPEFIVSYDMWSEFLVDAQGNLTAGNAWTAVLIALVTCFVTVAGLHALLPRVAKYLGGPWVVAGLILILVILVGQSAVRLMTDIRTGNSLDISSAQSLADQNYILLYAIAIRTAVILVAALLAASGSNLVVDGYRRACHAVRCRQDAKTAFDTVRKIDHGYQAAIDTRNEAMAKNAADARAFALAMVAGFLDMAQSLTRYLNGPPGPFVNPEQWLRDISEQLDWVSRDIDPAIGELVYSRLSKHLIDFGALPPLPEKLSAATRKRLGEYVVWLRKQADADAIFASTLTRLEDVHA